MAIDLSKEYPVINIEVSDCKIDYDFWAKQGDTGRGLIVKLSMNGEVITPSGEVVKLHMLKPDGKRVWVGGRVVQDKFYFDFPKQSLSTTGVMLGEFSITSMGKTKTTETFHIDVKKSMSGGYESDNGDAVGDADEVENLRILISKIEQYAPSIESWSMSEGVRVQSENIRVSSEADRTSSELQRVSMETERRESESLRVSQESGRVFSESIREQNEHERQENESIRIQSEQNRVDSEVIRKSTFDSRIQDMNNAILSGYVEWKAPVQNYASLLSTYPSPQLGWRVEVSEENSAYRYDGEKWEKITNGVLLSSFEEKFKKGMPNGYAPLNEYGLIPNEFVQTSIGGGSGEPIQINGAISNYVSNDMNAGKVVISNEYGKIDSSIISSEQLMYLDGVSSNIQQQINEKANLNHTHIISNIDGLSNELNSKADVSHSHLISDIQDLSTELLSKANSLHTHTVSDVSGLENLIETKEDLIIGAATTVTRLDLEPNKMLISDEYGKISISSFDSSLLQHLLGLDSDLQTQLNSKASIEHVHTEYLPIVGGTVSGTIIADDFVRSDGSPVGGSGNSFSEFEIW